MLFRLIAIPIRALTLPFKRSLSRGMNADDTVDGLAETLRREGALSPADQKTLKILWEETLKPDLDPDATIKRAAPAAPAQTYSPRIRHIASKEQLRVGADYGLLDVLGQGGMGVVYRARQDCLDRDVAVKMLKQNFSGDVPARERFRSEAIATGELQHPNIVPIYELGQTEDGQLFYAMPQVHGHTWKPRDLNRTGNLEVLMHVADAVAFAHSKGVVHRDLKPANVMLGGFGEVLVMDWGLAASLTRNGKIESLERESASGGSPAYMAPEQALGKHEWIGFQTDVYLLGSILFEVLTGVPPHTGKTAQEAVESAALNRIRPSDEQGELMSIARRALASQPADRFPTVKEFQLAIREYMAHAESVALAERAGRELLHAAEGRNYESFAKATYLFQESLALWPDHSAARDGERRARTQHAVCALDRGDLDLAASLMEAGVECRDELSARLDTARQQVAGRQRWLRRLAWSSCALAGALLVGFAISYVLIRGERDTAKRARDEARQAHLDEAAHRRAAEAAREETAKALDREEHESYAAQIGLAAQKIPERSFLAARELLADCEPRLSLWEFRRLNYLCHMDEWTLDGVEEPGNAVLFLGDGREAWVGSDDGQLRRVDVATGKVKATLRVPKAINCLARPSGPDRMVLAGCGDGHVYTWELPSGKVVGLFRADAKSVEILAFAPDGDMFATGGGEGVLRVWNVGQEKPVLELRGHTAPILALAFVPTRKQVLTGSLDRTVRLWDLSEGKCVHTFEGHPQPVFALAVRPDGRQAASAGKDGAIRLWDLEGRRAEGTIGEMRPAVFDLAYSPDGAHVVSSDFSHSATMYRPVPGAEPEHVFVGHGQPVYTAVFSPDGSRLLTGSADGTFKLWRARPPRREVEQLVTHDSTVLALSFARDNRLISGDDGGTAVVTDVRAGREIHRVKAHAKRIFSVAFSPDAKRWLTASQDGQVKVWDSATGQGLLTLAPPDETIAALTGRWSPDGRSILTGHADGTVHLWEAEKGASQGSWMASSDAVSCAEFSPDGRLIATAGNAREIKIWDTATRQLQRTLTGHRGPVTALRFTTDGQWLLSSSFDQTVRIWSPADGTLSQTLRGHLKEVMTVALSEDGKRTLTAGSDGTVRLWEFDSGRELMSLQDFQNGVICAAFSPAGDTVVTAGLNGTVWLWPTSK